MNRILIVEENPVMLKTTDYILKRQGYVVSSAIGTNEAVKLLKNNRFNLLIIDLTPPCFDGFELIDNVRKNYDNKNEPIPILVTTAHCTTECLEKSFEMGADDYLKKPFSPEELVSRVQRLLKDSR